MGFPQHVRATKTAKINFQARASGRIAKSHEHVLRKVS